MALSVVLEKMIIGRSFTTERGRIRTFGKIDWTLVATRGFARNLQKIGEASDRDFVFELGRRNGRITVKEIMSAFNMGSEQFGKNRKPMLDFFNTLGFGKISFSKFDNAGVIIQLKNNTAIEHGMSEHGKDAMVVCFFHGFFTGFLESAFGRKKLLLSERPASEGFQYEWETKTVTQ